MLHRGERLNEILPGQYYDKETGLHYNYFRDYDPSTGRYTQSDPIGLDGGSFSTYLYSGADPLMHADPMGLFTPEWHVSITVDAAVSAGFSRSEAEGWAYHVAGVDKWPGSQDPGHSDMHHMCAPWWTFDQCRAKFAGIAQRAFLTCRDVDIWKALHATQDGFAGGHKYFQTWWGEPTNEWLLPGFLASFVPHGFWDVSGIGSEAAAKASADLLMEWKQRCKCTK